MKRYESAFVLKSDLEGVVDEEVNASILLRCYSFPVTSMICSADAQGKLTVRRSINANAFFNANGGIPSSASRQWRWKDILGPWWLKRRTTRNERLVAEYLHFLKG